MVVVVQHCVSLVMICDDLAAAYSYRMGIIACISERRPTHTKMYYSLGEFEFRVRDLGG